MNDFEVVTDETVGADVILDANGEFVVCIGSAGMPLVGVRMGFRTLLD